VTSDDHSRVLTRGFIAKIKMAFVNRGVEDPKKLALLSRSLQRRLDLLLLAPEAAVAPQEGLTSLQVLIEITMKIKKGSKAICQTAAAKKAGPRARSLSCQQRKTHRS
jgi:hypothetical protein